MGNKSRQFVRVDSFRVLSGDFGSSQPRPMPMLTFEYTRVAPVGDEGQGHQEANGDQHGDDSNRSVVERHVDLIPQLSMDLYGLET